MTDGNGPDVVEAGPEGAGGGGGRDGGGGGPDRAGGLWHVVWWVVAIVAVGALVAATVRSGGDPARDAAPTPSPSPSPSTETFDSYVSEPEVSIEPTGGLQRLFAQAWTGPHDPLVLAGGGLVLRLKPGAQFPDAAGPSDGVVTSVIRLDRGTVFVADTDEAGRVAVTYLARGAGLVTSLGGKDAVYGAARAADPASVWLADAAPATGRRVTVRRVDLATGAVRQRLTLPPGTSLVAEVRTGLVLRPFDGFTDELWDRRGTRVVTAFDGQVVEVVPEHLLVADRTCQPSCVQVVGLDGNSRGVSALTAFEGPIALSPDARWVAAYCEDGSAMTLCVAGVGEGSLTLVIDSELAVDVPVTFAWSRDSKRLYLAVGGDSPDSQVLGWREGDQRLRLLTDVVGADTLVAE